MEEYVGLEPLLVSVPESLLYHAPHSRFQAFDWPVGYSMVEVV